VEGVGRNCFEMRIRQPSVQWKEDGVDRICFEMRTTRPSVQWKEWAGTVLK
jgi:hypothetical protein